MDKIIKELGQDDSGDIWTIILDDEDCLVLRVAEEDMIWADDLSFETKCTGRLSGLSIPANFFEAFATTWIVYRDEIRKKNNGAKNAVKTPS